MHPSPRAFQEKLTFSFIRVALGDASISYLINPSLPESNFESSNAVLPFESTNEIIWTTQLKASEW